MKEYLFLGGRMDGRKLEVANRQKRVVIHSEYLPWHEGEDPALKNLPPIPELVYHRVNLRCFGPTGHEVVFTHETRWSETRVVQHFLTNYIGPSGDVPEDSP